MTKSDKVLWTISAIVLIAIVIALVKQFVPSPDPVSKPKSRPAPTTVSNTYINQYAGGYTVEVIGYTADDIESYVLRRDGTVKWMWILPDASQGARVDSEKSGSWTASEGKIVISIRGNTGTIREEFRMRSGRFYSTTSTDRYLKPTE